MARNVIIHGQGDTPIWPTEQSRPFLYAADWLWNPIPDDPVIDTNSATYVSHFSSGSTGEFKKIPHIYNFAASVYGPGTIDGATSRYTITASVDSQGDGPWGNGTGGNTVPVPSGVLIPPPTIANFGDGHVAMADTTVNKVFSFWRFRASGATYTASTVSSCDIAGDGTDGDGSMAAYLPMIGGVITGAEMTAGVINHALFFSSNVAGPNPRYPARSTAPGTNRAGVSNPLPMGSRVFLDVDDATIEAITHVGWRIIAKALQTYGAYCIDNNTGSRMGFACEYLGGTASTPAATYSARGFTQSGGYSPHMSQIPWGSLKVLASWDGS